MAEYTPGPWHIIIHPRGSHWILAEKGIIARISGEKNRHPLGNAHLIAAAPDLLAACEAGLKALILSHPDSANFREQLESGELARQPKAIGPSRFDPTGRVRAAIRMQDVIAKAKGES